MLSDQETEIDGVEYKINENGEVVEGNPVQVSEEEQAARTFAQGVISRIINMEEIGLDLSLDTYDEGLHLNVYGAEKLSVSLGKS